MSRRTRLRIHRARGARAPKARGAATHERLLDAAYALFAEKGYAGTSTSEICRRAGAVKTALYWHFDSKEGLFAAALERAALAQVEEIQKNAYLGGDPLSRLDRFLTGLRELVEQRPEMIRLLLAAALERGDASDEMREMLRRLFRQIRQALVQGLEDGVGLRLPEAEWLAQMILSLQEGIMLRHLIDPADGDLTRLYAQMRETILLVVGQHIQRANQGVS
jgi:AcrR family transcriptional regulator